MNRKKVEAFREQLLAKRRELAGEVDSLRGGGLAVGDGPLDSGDEAAHSYAQQCAMDVGEAERNLLRQIDDALDRIDTGDFGVCGDCGEKIAEERLKAVPYTDLCVNCKSEQEKRGR